MSETKRNPLRVMIADDHSVVRHGLKQILSLTPDFVVVEEAETGNQVLEKLRSVEVDVLVMDIEMPEKTAWDVLPSLKNSHPNLPVVILSIHSEDQYGARALQAGASAYLSKTSAPDKLVEAIRKVAQ